LGDDYFFDVGVEEGVCGLTEGGGGVEGVLEGKREERKAEGAEGAEGVERRGWRGRREREGRRAEGQE
jgi:hypothetical protein